MLENKQKQLTTFVNYLDNLSNNITKRKINNNFYIKNKIYILVKYIHKLFNNLQKDNLSIKENNILNIIKNKSLNIASIQNKYKLTLKEIEIMIKENNINSNKCIKKKFEVIDNIKIDENKFESKNKTLLNKYYKYKNVIKHY